MVVLRVFDPPMCCSTGICGPSVDPGLARFAADVNWLKSQGIQVERFNLAQNPNAFTKDSIVEQMVNIRCVFRESTDNQLHEVHCGGFKKIVAEVK